MTFKKKFTHVMPSLSGFYKPFLTFTLSFFFWNFSNAQIEVLSYSFDSYQKLEYSGSALQRGLHSSIKPFILNDTILSFKKDSLSLGSDTTLSLWNRKWYNKHLIQINKPGYTFYADILPGLQLGEEFNTNKTTYTVSIGAQLGGSFGKKVNYFISGYQNQAGFPDYLATYIKQVGIIPGQSIAKPLGDDQYHWSLLTGMISYTPNPYLNISGGIGKTFIGDGYRSLLLSDYASPYPFIKLTGTLGHVRYMVMYSFMDDPAFTSQYGIDRKKFGVFHYLDWTVSRRVSLGFFENIMGFFTDDNGAKRPFDLNYLNPILFLKPVNNSSDNPDKSLLGLTSKFKVSNNVIIYGQFALNEFHSKDFFSSNGAFDNKYGWQLGIKGNNLFKVMGLNYLLETNNVKPYTYEARSAIENYSSSGEPLAHPWGANFREALGILTYAFHSWNFSFEADYGHYGLDSNSSNNGKDIFKLYPNFIKQYGNYTGQGITTNMVYLSGKIFYILNPKTNLRIELEGIFRNEKNILFNNKTTWLNLSLKSSFRGLYRDLASYKIH